MKGKTKKVIEFLIAVGLMAIGAAVVVGLIVGVITGLVQIGRYVSGHIRPASVMAADVPAEGIGRAAVRQYGAFVCAGEAEVGLPTYTEGDGPAPEWYRPEEPMAAVWTADEGCNILATNLQPDTVDYNARRDIGCPDWNVDSTLYGWDGRTMEAWEMELFARIFYREFWQSNLMLCEAGCDAMLGLWELDGGTMYETLSHINEDGSYSFSTFPGVWESEYDPDGLAWCRAYCEERFYEGPSWPAQYFRKGHYHDWGEWSPIPAYEIDGIYFSIGKER